MTEQQHRIERPVPTTDDPQTDGPLMRGLAQSKRGETVDLGSFAQYAEQPSLPTREQIAEAVDQAGEEYRLSSSDERFALIVADKVLTLLSQPTPTAERDDLLACLEIGDDGYNRWDTDALDRLLERRMKEPTTGPCERCGGTGYQGDGPLTLGIPCPNCHTGKPPRIEDMAPGTTFSRDDYPDEVWTVKRDICDGGLYALSDGHRSQNAEDIDPSTIRDVTPPNESTK